MTSVPQGASLYVDGDLVGETPRRMDDLAAGRHQITVEYAGYATYEDSVKIVGGRETLVVAELKAKRGKLTVTSSPGGGDLWVDGKEVGKTPWSGRVGPGPHDVLVNLVGHAPGGETVIVPATGDKTVDITLLIGTPIIVPEGNESLIRTADRRFEWPSKTEHEGKDGAPMVLVPEGAFLMGSPDSDRVAYAIEQPQRTVRLGAFLIDKYEVPNAQYRRFLHHVKISGHDTCVPGEPAAKDHTPGTLSFWGTEWNRPGQPVAEVDWWDAASYCAWAGGRLPTEAEWEKAARGSEGRIYPWGDDPPGAFLQGNFLDLSFLKRMPEWTWIVSGYDDRYAWTAPIGSYPRGASPYGVEDMAGNVWEWVADWFSEDTYRKGPDENPQGPRSGQYRIVRGGSWNDADWNLRAANRLKLLPGFRVNFVGFRCASDAK